ncbi:uncharacterized protein LOC142231477 [Haematobia irritans]|uniref:uncharacterized protein LOC142231477 n=1 Tax=Haematobia irritans TaxID=7368 RepID=UPI003F500EA9
MPVISPRRSSTSASGNIYGTSSSTVGSSVSSADSSSSRLGSDRLGSSSAYKSYLDRTSSLSKFGTSSSSYSPNLSYLNQSSYSSYSPRSSTSYRPSSSSLTGGSSGVGTYRSILPSLGSSSSSSNYDTTTLSRYGVKNRGNTLDLLKNDCNGHDRAVFKKPPSGSDSGGGSRDAKRAPGSSSSSSLARLVATSGLDMYEKYSPANYKPNTELSGSRSGLNEASNETEDRGRTVTTDITTPTIDDILLERSRNRYSRLYSRSDTDETDNITSAAKRSLSGTRSAGNLNMSNSSAKVLNSSSTEDVPTVTLSRTRLRRPKHSEEIESNKPLKNGTLENEISKPSSLDRPLVTSNDIDTVVHIKLNKLKLSNGDVTSNKEDKLEKNPSTNNIAEAKDDSESSKKVIHGGENYK